MDLRNYTFPKLSDTQITFGTVDVPEALLEEARKREISDKSLGMRLFSDWFFKGIKGLPSFKDDTEGVKNCMEAIRFTRALMGSFRPKHEHKEMVCAMILEEYLDLKDYYESLDNSNGE